MNSMILMAFTIMVGGVFLLLDLSPFDLIDDLSKLKPKKKESLKKRIEYLTKKRKRKGIKSMIQEAKMVLNATNKTDRFTGLLIGSLMMFVGGIYISIIMNNLFMIPVLSIGFALLPFWYVRIIAIRWRKELNSELETALSIITTSYLRSDSIITAIEENINYINPPVYDVFRIFLTQSKLINSNIKIALENLKSGIDSAVFHEWVDALIDCREDKNIKHTLVPIVSKLSDMRIVSGELDYLMYEPVKEFVSMAVLLVGNIPLMYMLNRDWYNTLMYTTVGKGVLAMSASALFISLGAIIRLTKPVEYRR